MGYHKLKAYGGKGGGGLWDFKAEVAPGQGYGEMRKCKHESDKARTKWVEKHRPVMHHHHTDQIIR